MGDIVALAKFAETHAKATGVSPSVHIDDHIFRFVVGNPVFTTLDHAVKYYFVSGRDSASKLKGLIEEFSPDNRTPSLLEFAAGYGCVSRHFKNVLPDARVVSCDIHDAALVFLEQTLGMAVARSHTDPKAFSSSPFDVVFALSFFSHMPRKTWGAWVRALYGAVNPGGLLIFTTHGQVSREKFFGDPPMPKDGFFFRAESEQKDIDTAEYGQTIVSEAFVRAELQRQIGRSPDVFREAFWWSHQDLYIVRKP